MNKFFVGMKVRILYSFFWPELAGKEGRIYGVGVFGDSIPEREGKECWLVKPDCWKTKSAMGPDYLRHDFGCTEDQMEPIIPDGMKPASWEDTVWDPSRLVEESKELVCLK